MSGVAERQFYTYLHCKPNGDPFYVGKGHGDRCRSFGPHEGRNSHHQRTVTKYGQQNIGIFVFDCDSEQQAIEDEIKWIRQLREQGFELTNKTDGGQGVCGLRHSEETKKRLSEMNKGKQPRLGWVPSAETRAKISAHNRSHEPEVKAKISAAGLGRHHTAEAKAKIGAASIGRKPSLGKKATPETRAKLSASHRGWKWGEVHWRAYAEGRLNPSGKPRSPETIAKMSAALKGKPWTPARREAKLRRSIHHV